MIYKLILGAVLFYAFVHIGYNLISRRKWNKGLFGMWRTVGNRPNDRTVGNRPDDR